MFFSKILSCGLLPIRRNGGFFVFMYALLLMGYYFTAPKPELSDYYGEAWLEIFVDLYIVCILLALIPQKVRRWVRAVLYVLLYSTVIADVFCFVKFGSPITPTMLLLLGETNSREAGEFVSTYLNFDLLSTNLGWIILLLIVHIIKSFVFRKTKWLRKWISFFAKYSFWGIIGAPVASIAVLALFIYGIVTTWDNKEAYHRLINRDNIGEVEHELTRHECRQHTAIHRLLFSINANRLASKQIVQLLEAKDDVKVDSCDYTSPNIVLIIGESYNRHHSQLYGYDVPTTPWQTKTARQGMLTPFSDVIAPWNLTSFVFKNIFSTHVVGQEGEWCDYPMFPQLFRAAGYHVTFITNQFLPKAKEAVYDFSGGFFLNHPELSRSMFDTRNTQTHQYDEALLKDYANLTTSSPRVLGDSVAESSHNLIIFHLYGQHVAYGSRCPKERHHFKSADYDSKRRDLNKREKIHLASYDNATLYNDSVVSQIVRLFQDQDAIVLYLSDHGEQVFDDGGHVMCRQHNVTINKRIARNEYDIPFWIWCSPQYIKNHPDVVQAVKKAKDRPYMTDALPHLLLWLGGIHTPEYHSEYNILSDDYNTARKRIIKSYYDYDRIINK